MKEYTIVESIIESLKHLNNIGLKRVEEAIAEERKKKRIIKELAADISNCLTKKE